MAFFLSSPHVFSYHHKSSWTPTLPPPLDQSSPHPTTWRFRKHQRSTMTSAGVCRHSSDVGSRCWLVRVDSLSHHLQRHYREWAENIANHHEKKTAPTFIAEDDTQLTGRSRQYVITQKRLSQHNVTNWQYDVTRLKIDFESDVIPVDWVKRNWAKYQLAPTNRKNIASTQIFSLVFTIKHLLHVLEPRSPKVYDCVEFIKDIMDSLVNVSDQRKWRRDFERQFCVISDNFQQCRVICDVIDENPCEYGDDVKISVESRVER